MALASSASSNCGRGTLYAYGNTAGANRSNVTLTRSVGDQTNDTPGLRRLKLAVSFSRSSRRRIGITAGTSDSPTSSGGRRPSSKTVTAAPSRTSKIARAVPDGPPPTMAAAARSRSRRVDPSHLLAHDLDDPRGLDLGHDALDPRRDDVAAPSAAVEEYADSRPGRNDRDVVRVGDLAAETVRERIRPV